MFKVQRTLLTVLVTAFFLSMFSIGSANAEGVYSVLDAPAISGSESAGDLKSLGTVYAEIESGSLSDSSVLTVRLPEGFSFSDTPIDVTNGALQNSPQGNADRVEIFAPPVMSGNINSLNQNGTPGLNIIATKISSNQISFQLSIKPVIVNKGYFFLYLKGIYVPLNFSGDVAIQIDSNEGFGIAQSVVAVNGNEIPNVEVDSDKDTESNPVANKTQALFYIGANKYSIDGSEYIMDVAPYMKDGRTFIPVLYAAKALGIELSNIKWSPINQTVTLIKDGRSVELRIGSKTMLVNGTGNLLDAAPEITSGRTCLPISGVAQALQADIKWEELNNIITIEW